MGVKYIFWSTYKALISDLNTSLILYIAKKYASKKLLK